jgi:hypothetical protein
VAGRFPVYTDADVHGPFIKALKKAGWDIVRGIDALAEGADDPSHFERAVALGRVLVTNDEDHDVIANQWFRAGRSFPGVVSWRQKTYRLMTNAELVEVFERLAAQDNPFSPYPLIRVKPKR